MAGGNKRSIINGYMADGDGDNEGANENWIHNKRTTFSQLCKLPIMLLLRSKN